MKIVDLVSLIMENKSKDHTFNQYKDSIVVHISQNMFSNCQISVTAYALLPMCMCVCVCL